MEEISSSSSHQKSKSPRRKVKSKVKPGGSSQQGENYVEASSSHRHRSKDDVERLVPKTQSPTTVAAQLEASSKKTKHPRKSTSEHKKISKKDREKKSPSPNAVALARSELTGEPRSITPPKRALSEQGLLEGTRSFHGDDSDLRAASSGARASLANLFKLDDSPKVIRTTKPLWMKGSMAWETSHTPTRQRLPPPPESPQSGKARLMVQQRKLERSSSHDRTLGGLDVGDVVQRRRRKHFDKCAKASIQIQRIARGWLVRNRLHPNQSSKGKGHKHKEDKHKQEKHKHKSEHGKKPSKAKCERELSLSPRRLIDTSAEPSLTPLQNAMRLSLRRLGASEKDLAEKLSASERDLFSNSFARKPAETDFLLYKTEDEDDDADLEQNLCSIFKSNIANATARARRRSFRGEMSDSFANMEGIL